MSLISIKIFVSSPGHVAQERFLTEKVLTRLQNVYRRLGNTADSNAERAVLKQIAAKSPADGWQERARRGILDAEVLSVCGPAAKPKKENE